MNNNGRPAWREIARKPGESAYSIIWYAVAVGVVVTLAAMLSHASRLETSAISTADTNFMIYEPYCGDCPVKEIPYTAGEGPIVDGRQAKLLDAYVPFRAATIPSIKDASPYLLFSHEDAKSGRCISVGGFDPSSAYAVAANCCSPEKMREGKFLAPTEKQAVMLEKGYAISLLTSAELAKLREAAKAARENKALAELLDEEEEAAETKKATMSFPKTIQLAGEIFSVTGVVEAKGLPGKADVYMHIDDAARIADKRLKFGKLEGRTNTVVFAAKSPKVLDEAMAQARNLWPPALISGRPLLRKPVGAWGLNAQAAGVLMVGIAFFTTAMLLWGNAWFATRRKEAAPTPYLGKSLVTAAIGAVGGLLVAFIILQVISGLSITTGQGGVYPPPLVAVSAVVISLAVGLISGVIAERVR